MNKVFVVINLDKHGVIASPMHVKALTTLELAQQYIEETCEEAIPKRKYYKHIHEYVDMNNTKIKIFELDIEGD